MKLYINNILVITNLLLDIQWKSIRSNWFYTNSAFVIWIITENSSNKTLQKHYSKETLFLQSEIYLINYPNLFHSHDFHRKTYHIKMGVGFFLWSDQPIKSFHKCLFCPNRNNENADRAKWNLREWVPELIWSRTLLLTLARVVDFLSRQVCAFFFFKEKITLFLSLSMKLCYFKVTRPRLGDNPLQI